MNRFLLTDTASQYPHEIGLDDGQAQWSWSAIEAQTIKLASALWKEGLKAGDRVVLYGGLSAHKVLLFWSLVRLGCVVAPLSQRFTEEERALLLEPVSPAAVVCEGGSWRGPAPAKTLSWEALFESAAGESCPVPAPIPDEHRPTTLIWTSGSSSRPKAALHSLFNHLQSARGARQNLPLGCGDRWWLSLPVVHVAGVAILCRCALSGATVTLAEPGLSLAEQLLRARPTHLSLVATQLQRLLRAGDEVVAALQRAKAILLGGSAIPGALLREAERLELPVMTSYGSTEMSSQITTTRPSSTLAQRFESSGWLLPHRELKINEEGLICVRGDTLFLGYWDKEGPRRVLDSEGWWVTRDRGVWNSDHSLRVLGRQDNMMISGGENIQPEEIEEALCSHDEVLRALVVPVRDREFGQRPVAFLQWGGQGSVGEEELRKYLRLRLARFKVPDHFLDWPESVEEGGLKVHRETFRAIAEDSLVQWKRDCDKT